MLKNIVLLCVTLANSQGIPYHEEYYWNGKWFPHSPNEPDSNPSAHKTNHLITPSQRVIMGERDISCDDAKTYLAVDWFMDPANYTCFENKKVYLPQSHIHPIHTIEHIPTEYSAPHRCMNESIEYNELVPTFGTHRPLWAVYGEYTFVPKQRWIHNLEHGAVVMLYHPCANKNQVRLLRNIVRSCLYKHVITPYNYLTPERPLALVTWGHRLEMSKVSSEVVNNFIQKHALNGPEKTPKDGQYSLMLERRSKIVSDLDDTKLCPNHVNTINMK
ncbi:unnamed protein product [Phaedon cochleariae]|uniref:Uncharacterized protein n=1 Tax=Phaedon cochleariae TaxID=80249 RepID=A0A9P0DKP1_PHACE|nr:unnamed protein product [Phaedon cochleariae]